MLLVSPGWAPAVSSSISILRCRATAGSSGRVESINTTDTKIVKTPNMAQGLVSNTHCEKTCILRIADRISGRKAKLTTSGANKTKFVDETNHAGVHLLPAEAEADGWVPTLTPLTLLSTTKGQTLDIIWGFLS